MKTILLLCIIACFVKSSLAQATCSTCEFGVYLRAPDTDSPLVQFRDTVALALGVIDSLTGAPGYLNTTAAVACARSPSPCGTNSTCTPATENDYLFRCNCDALFSADRSVTSFSCVDLDECSSSTTNNCSANANCTNLEPGYNCTCNTGYTGNGTTCEDIDECALNDTCHTNANCTNTDGSFTCECITGYSGDGINTCDDIDECSNSTLNNCHDNANCTNNNASYECECHQGYTGDGFQCEEINECTNGTHNCSDFANCTNTNGSFTCACHDGFNGDGVNCTDIDECAGTNNCSQFANCTNTNGSYTCECFEGYTGDGYNCTDIDECSDSSLNNCSTNASCNDTEPSYTCTCNDGYEGDGFNCTDIDECSTSRHNCSNVANCTDTNGGFQCECWTGYTGDGVTCTDINECDNNTLNDCHANANCTNNNASYSCECHSGYTGDGFNCTEINECTPDPCHTNANCTDLVNDFNCTCNPGYTGNGTYCEDEIQCNVTDNCDGNATCADTDGSFTCTCNAGYTGDGVSCNEVDECASNPCDTNANCTDLVNDFNCTCYTGYTGNGLSCERNRQNVTFSFYSTLDNVTWNIDLQNSSSDLAREVEPQVRAAFETVLTRLDSNATIIELNYTWDTSQDGDNVSEALISCTCFTNAEVNDVLTNINTMSSPALNLSSSANECELNIDQCNAIGRTCKDSNYRFCCVDDLRPRVNVTVDVTFDQSYMSILTDSRTIQRLDSCQSFVEGFLGRIQDRGCLHYLSFEAFERRLLEGSIVHVLGLLLRDATFNLEDITNELAKAVGENTTFGSIIAAGDFDECIASYAEYRNCSDLAECLNFAGNFTCQCNETYYDNGTSPGEICINPITVACDGNIMNVSILWDYYNQRNISLDSLHLADEACNRTTHSNIDGDSIEFSVDINHCNTTLAYSADNTSIIASNYISNLPSTGVFTGLEVVVPFECKLPVGVNITLGLNGTVDTVKLPNVAASGEFDLKFACYNQDFSTEYSAEQTYLSTDTIYGQVSIQNTISSLSVNIEECYGTPSSSRTDPERHSFISDGCGNNGATNFNMLRNGQGSARFSLQMFFFTPQNSVWMHCTAQVCTPNCAKTCGARRRRRSTAERTDLVLLSWPLLLDPSDPMFNNRSFPIIGIPRPGPGDNSGNTTNDIALPLISAILAFVLIVLLALLVLVVVRKRRSSKEDNDMTHVNMHAIGVKPPEY